MEYLNKNLNKILSLQDYALSSAYENVELVIYSALCFFVPFFMGHPQYIVGVAVNAALITAALNLKSWKLLPVIMLPSLAVVSRGVIFGPWSIFLVYMIPFIWVGNSILVLSFKHFRLGKKYSYFTTLLMGAGFKSAFLFASALILYKLSIVPAVFLISMGLLQLGTALIGGAAAYGIHQAKKQFAAN